MKQFAMDSMMMYMCRMCMPCCARFREFRSR